jgi:hypothetical protein
MCVLTNLSLSEHWEEMTQNKLGFCLLTFSSNVGKGVGRKIESVEVERRA